MSLKGKTAFITGASRGIGKSIALTLAKDGADIIFNSTKETEKTQELEKEITALGVKCLYIAGDVSSYEAVTEMIEKIKEKFDQVDILVNNAGITRDRTLKKMSQEEWDSVININLNSMYTVTKQMLKVIPPGGRIINVSSIVGISGNFGQSNYAASKAGMIGFSKALSKELGKKKITVNVVAPGFIKTEMTEKIPIMVLEQILELVPMKEMGLPEDVAKTISFLSSDGAKYITGEVIRIDGGLQM